jgi:hypothetical protein
MAGQYSKRLIWLTDAQARSEAAAKNEVGQALAGKARHLYELAAGVSPDGGEPASGRNPQGLIGVDYSGPPWGSAIRHPIAWIGGAKPGSWKDPILSCTQSSPASILNWRFWVRPFDHPRGYIAPYSRGIPTFRAYLSSAGSSTVTVAMWHTGVEDEAMETDLIVNSTTESSFPTDGFTTISDYVPLRPGWNTVSMRFRGNTDSYTVHITSVAIHQMVKRSH